MGRRTRKGKRVLTAHLLLCYNIRKREDLRAPAITIGYFFFSGFLTAAFFVIFDTDAFELLAFDDADVFDTDFFTRISPFIAY